MFSLGEGWLCSGVFGVLLAFSLWIYGGRLDETKKEAELWKASSLQNITALEEARLAYESLNSLLASREHELEDIRTRYQSIQARIEEVLHNDNTAQKWSSSCIPSSVLNILCRHKNDTGDNHNQAYPSDAADGASVCSEFFGTHERKSSCVGNDLEGTSGTGESGQKGSACVERGNSSEKRSEGRKQ